MTDSHLCSPADGELTVRIHIGQQLRAKRRVVKGEVRLRWAQAEGSVRLVAAEAASTTNRAALFLKQQQRRTRNSISERQEVGGFAVACTGASTI